MENEVRNLLLERAKNVRLRHDSFVPTDVIETTDLRLRLATVEEMQLYVAIMSMLTLLGTSKVSEGGRTDIEIVRKYINGRDAKTVLFDILWGEVIHTLPQLALDKIKDHECRLAIRRDWQLVLEPIAKPVPVELAGEAQLRQQELTCPGS